MRYAPAPAWVVAPPMVPDTPVPPGAPLRVVYSDNQVRLSDKGQEEYQATRLKLLTPEGLAAGNMTMAWSPDNEDVIVHRLAIHRDGRTIDVLANQKFRVIQRENNLERSMLDGNLTATLQTAGLQVGDEIEFVATKIRHLDAGARPQAMMQFPIIGMRGSYRLRTLEPAGAKIAFRASANLPSPVERKLGAETELQYLLVDPASATVPDGAPARFAITRVAQFSGYEDWAAVSHGFATLFDGATRLAANSPLKAEAARMAAAAPDPLHRAEAALRFVQDRIRYVFVGLDGGNYRPAGADQTWERRFGDCKAKTVLLIALLREMGIAAEPVLVSSKGGDGIDQLLPTPAAFDHVVVRATIGGQSVWLDGTRLGDRLAAGLPPPTSRWGLPLRAAGAPLEKIAPVPPPYPLLIEAVEIDASAGFDKPGKYRVQQTLRTDEIFGIRAQLSGMAAADADKLLAAYWRQRLPEIDPTRTTWRFDDDHRLLVLGIEGEGKVDWDGDAANGRTHYLYGGGFPPPAEMKRPKDQPQDAPWANEYPAFSCYATTVKTPSAGPGFRWSFSSKPMDRRLGGIDYWRISSFDGRVARMVKSRRVVTPEITAAEATSVNAMIKGFDNNKSYLSEVRAASGGSGLVIANTLSRFGGFDDFAGAAPPCQSQVGGGKGP